jgi:tol-pal system-associated acyl-CoA thioesterase
MNNQFIYPLRVHIEDTDYTGLVYHANYLNFMERARSEWVDALGLGMAWQRDHGLYFVMHTANIRFLKPARVHDRLEVVSSITSIRSASLVFDQCLRFAGSPDKLLCKAEIKVACVGENMQPKPLPELPILQTMRRLIS